MDGTFIEALANEIQAKEFEINGIKYTDKKLYLQSPPAAQPLTVGTLDSLADYLISNKDALDTDKVIVHVENYNSVNVYDGIEKKYMQRNHFLGARFASHVFPDGYMCQEDFLIAIQARFQPKEYTTTTAEGVEQKVNNLATLGKYVGATRDFAEGRYADDGISQKTTIRQGTESGIEDKEVVVKNPITLSPYVTFPELEQPDIKYILRMQHGPEFALFRVKDDKWKNAVVASIKAYLANKFEQAKLDITILA